ncbi:TetR/AcrR family transcriptional regulator [Lysinibacillus sp. NPDC094403]|uniref:TetR/AcrR family transcriptional regulator n=1 Tax=Lysinibacillus sp. NPDC094403 TaxID=3390581 RepID=UPI003D08A648
MAKPTGIEKSYLLTAARQSLVEKGIEKFTLKAVAEQAGVTQGTIYYHFKSKEQIILEIVQDICEDSWNEILMTNQELIQSALLSAKSRYENDAFYHKLFSTLIVYGFTNPTIRQQIGQILASENEHLCNILNELWDTSPIDGVSMETWSIFFNALIDGLAIQVMMRDDFDVDVFYLQLETILQALRRLGK